MIYRHRAESSNAIWQADHTMLDLLILDEKGQPVRPWLTTVMDDYSRAVAGASVFLGAPSTLNTCLALRQAIWRKADATWPIPDVLRLFGTINSELLPELPGHFVRPAGDPTSISLPPYQ